MSSRTGFHITPDILAACYEYLRATPPFNRWGLPHADEVTFVITRELNTRGYCSTTSGEHEIGVSMVCITQTDSLMKAMSHEMVHAHCDRRGVRKHHGAEFQKFARQVCNANGWDPGLF